MFTDNFGNVFAGNDASGPIIGGPNVAAGNQGGGMSQANMGGMNPQALAQLMGMAQNNLAGSNIPNALAAQQMGAVQGFGGQIQNAMGQIAGVNSANQQAALTNSELWNQLQQQQLRNQGAIGLQNAQNTGTIGNTRINAGENFAKAALFAPIASQLASSLSGFGGAGGLSGYSSTNSPQRASLPMGGSSSNTGGTTPQIGSASGQTGGGISGIFQQPPGGLNGSVFGSMFTQNNPYTKNILASFLPMNMSQSGPQTGPAVPHY